ncbi:MAG: RNA-guided endonuclease IscB [Bacilli bacterium]|nr:RNA-guided endonuclease IscB [Bacilli bacterium]
MVYVIDQNNKPLMPCSNVIARLLLKQGKAKVVRRTPFTIKLLYGSSGYKQPLTHGVDTGSDKIGSAVVNDKEEVVYMSEITIRNDIVDKMKQRNKYRRNRRNRKTRYRKVRWANRKNSIKKDRFSPTMISKFNSHFKEINFVKSILPITKLIIETANFDPHLLKNPVLYNEKIKKWAYQRGTNYGFANTKAFVLDRDSYKCQHCKGKSKDKRLEVHHIIFRSNNGSDEQDNLITLCKTCHDMVHDGKIVINGGKVKGNLKHATQMNSIRIQLLKRLPYAEETFGYITKEHRQLFELPKEHYIDAVVIACQGNAAYFNKTKDVIYKRCASKGDYQQTKGIRSEKRIPTGKLFGFRKFDKVRYLGKEYFIKGRRSSGYFVLMGIDNKGIDFKPIPKVDKMIRIASRKSWISEMRRSIPVLSET